VGGKGCKSAAKASARASVSEDDIVEVSVEEGLRVCEGVDVLELLLVRVDVLVAVIVMLLLLVEVYSVKM
jgi:hypothetical protein